MNWQLMGRIQRATLDARARTGDPTIGTTLYQGKAQIVRVVYNDKGTSTVTPVGTPDTPEAIITKLKGI